MKIFDSDIEEVKIESSKYSIALSNCFSYLNRINSFIIL